MQSWMSNPTFVVYVIAGLVLTVNLLFLWVYSGTIRGKTKTVINPEDAGTIVKGVSVVSADPPEVARVLRAHTNAMGAIVPFLFLGLVYVMVGGAPGPAKGIFGVFVVARLFHSFVYLGEKQPWRTIAFVTGLLATVGLLGYVGWLMTQSA